MQSKYKRNKLQLKEWKERHIKLQKQFDNFREIKNSQVKTMDDEIKHLRDINSILESTQLGNVYKYIYNIGNEYNKERSSKFPIKNRIRKCE